MRPPRSVRSKVAFRGKILTCLILAIAIIGGYGLAETAVSAELRSIAAAIFGNSPSDRRNDQKKASLNENVSGRFIFDLDRTIQKIENIGSSNDVTHLTFLADSEPVFSPDGSKILFRTQRDSDLAAINPGELWIMEPDGFNQRRLTFNSSQEGNYSFSRNGEKIAFEELFSGRIWVMNSDGTGLAEISDPDLESSDPSLSPDGSKVVFIRDGYIWISDSDGSDQQLFYDNGNAEHPFFSLTGDKIFWIENASVMSANLDGSGLEIVVDGSNDDFNWFQDAVFSPNGEKLLFECERFNTRGICIARTDGSNTIDLIEEQGDELEKPVWSPNGSQVGYVRTGANGHQRIWFANANGTNRFEAFDTGSASRRIERLAWQPECQEGGGGGIEINTDGLVSWWRGENSAEDSFGNNDGNYDIAFFTPGRVGNAFYFNGEGGGNFVEIPDDDSLDVQDGDYTLAGWVNIQQDGREHYFFGKGACCTPYNFYVGVDQDNRPFLDVSHETGGARVAAFGHELDLYTWTHLALRREGNEFRLYKNGEHVVTHTEPLPIGTNEAPFTIGKGDGMEPPELTAFGMADEVVLYGRALSQGEIQALVNMSELRKVGSSECPPVQKSRISIGGPFLWPIAQGRTAQVDIKISQPAPAGGTVISLESALPSGLTVPETVTIPEFSTNATFEVTTHMWDPAVYFTVDITASEGPDTARTTAVLAPASPDLAASNLIAPATVNILQNFNADITVTNNGQVATGSYREDEIWISQDPVLFNDPSDTFVGLKFDNSGILAPGQSKIFTATDINIPSAAIPTDGTYYLFYRVGRNINERGGNFQDNYAFTPIQVNRNLSDLIAENIVVPSEIEPGVQFTINWDVRNAGSAGTINPHRSDLYISYDDVIGNADDVLIAQRFSPAWDAGQSQSFVQQYTVPTLPVRDSSDALIYVVVDAAGQVFEDDPGGPAEMNNTASVPVRFEYRVPDLQVASVSPPAEVDSDTQFAIEWTTTNAGLRSSGPMYERVYFSTDNQVGGDVQIGEFIYNNPIAPGDSVTRIQNVSIPTNAISATGDYFVYVQTDVYNQVNEGANEDNNITFAPVRVIRLLRPDLQVTNVTNPPTAFFDQEIQVQWTVSNNGTGPTNSPHWTDEVYLGVNPTMNGADRLTSGSNVSYLDVGESYIASATIKIPRGATGSFYIIARTDANNTVNEENENNNFAASPITINVPPLPDLRVSNVQAPAEGFGGAPILVSWTVTNHGDGAVPQNESTWRDAIYLSRNNVFDGGDRLIGWRVRNGSLAAGSSYTVTNFSVDLPGDAFGEYYVFVFTDQADQVYEFTNEGNNTDYDQIEPGSPMNVLGTPPDLIIPSPISAPSTIIAGQPISTTFSVQNQGAFDAVGTWREALFLSPDPTLEIQDDIFLGIVARSGLGAGQSYTAAINGTIPNCLDGSYYLIAKTDIFNNVFEFDPKGDGEGNNLSVPKPLSITSFAPDLRVTNVTVPPVVVNGAMPISWTVKNQGSGATVQNGWNDRVALVHNGQLIVLGTFQRVGPLAVDGEYTQNQVVYLPLYLQGEVAIFVDTDIHNAVPECGNEENNRSFAFTEAQSDLPDLRINSVGAPGSATLGSTISVTWTGQNWGSPLAAASWADRVYLSSNQTLEWGDQLLGGQLFSQPLAQNGTYNGQAEVTIPSVPVGSYYLLVVADAGDNIAEGFNENNNVTAIPIMLTTPPVDLQVTSIAVDPMLYSGQFAEITWTVTNNGSQATASGTWSDWLVLSRDSVFDPSDTVLAFQRRNGALGPGANYSDSRTVSLPPGLTGDYRILVITDRHNEVAESNEANNITSAPVVLQLPPPAELNITNITPPAAIAMGESASISWTVQNSSVNPAAGTWQDAVYLSTDQIWDSGDIYIGRKERTGTLGAFATYTETLDTVIPPVEPGSYYVIVRTDSRNSVRESNETNNVASSVLQTSVTLQGLELGTPLLTTLTTGQERFYRILNVPVDETMLISLNGEEGSSNELYTREGSMVSRSNYDLQGMRQGEPDQENLVRNTSAENYNSMIRGDFVPGSFREELRQNDQKKKDELLAAQAVTLSAELIPFSIRTASPGTAGNGGYSMIAVRGAKFQEGATLKLVGTEGEIVPVQNYFFNPTDAAALFDLRGVAPGNYQLILTNPDSQSAVWPEDFVITQGGGERLRTEISGPTEVRGNFFTRYTIAASNEGKNDAIAVPIIVILSETATNYQLSTANYLGFTEVEGVASLNTVHFDVDGKRILALFAPIIRAGESVNIGIDIAFSNRGTITAEALSPIFNRELSDLEDELNLTVPSGSDVAKCWANLVFNALLTALGEIFPIKCASGIARILAKDVTSDTVSNVAGGVRTGNFGAFDTLIGIIFKAGRAIEDCFLDGVRYIPPLKIVSIVWDIYQLLKLTKECIDKTAAYTVNVHTNLPNDPNDKVGPLGFGPEKWVPQKVPLEYRINFENVSTATAHAHRVLIVDDLPPTLDPRTVRLKEIGFKQYRFEVPPNRAFYQARVQLGEDLDNIQADISAGLNIMTGRITWTITAIDPATGEEPVSPFVGVLPPNNEDRDGEGYVIFTVQPKADRPTRTELANFATIYFDDNEEIVTNVTSNLLDADVPESEVAPLPATSETPSFNVSWGGSDDANGSGLNKVDIYFSENGGPYGLFTSSTGPGSAVFTGNWGRTYRFYSVATDNAGNVEELPETPDATVTVLGGAFEGDVAPRPGGDNDGSVTVADLTQIRRFVAELDTDLTLNEFQRADTAPLITFGDGILSVSDIVQARRYAAGLDSVNFAAGPNEAVDPGLVVRTIDGKQSDLMPREIRPVAVSRVGDRVKIAVDLEAQGDEVAVGFTLNFDPNVIGNPTNITLGPGSVGMSLTTNTSQAAQGRIGIVMDKDPTQPIPVGTQRLVTIDFDVAPSNPSTALIAFGNSPVRREVVNGLAQTLTTTFSDTVVSLVGPTSAPAAIAGRVTSTNGGGVQNVVITVTNAAGTSRRATTNAFGYFRLEGLSSGQTYSVTASRRSFTFDPPGRVVTLDADIADVDFRVLR